MVLVEWKLSDVEVTLLMCRWFGRSRDFGNGTFPVLTCCSGARLIRRNIECSIAHE